VSRPEGNAVRDVNAESELVWMGYGGAIGLIPGCNANRSSHNNGFATRYSTFINDSDHSGMTLFTGSANYQVKDVEIFEFFD
jgi:hypothetical protein